jgi:hypothetical protein
MKRHLTSLFLLSSMILNCFHFAIAENGTYFEKQAFGETKNNSELGPWINVKQFGAKGDGIADDTLSLQSAIEFGSKRHRIVFFPEGTYRIKSKLKMGPNVTLQGEGVGFGSQIRPVKTVALSFDGNDFPKNNGFTFQNRIIGLMINMADAKGFEAITMHAAYTVKLEDVAITYAEGDGIRIADSTNIILQNIRVEGLSNGTGTGVIISHSEVEIYNIDLEGFLNGMTISHADGGVHLFGGYMERHGAYGILFSESSYNSVIGVTIAAPNSGGIPIGFRGSPGFPSTQNTIISSSLSIGNSAPGTLIYLDENSSNNLLINLNLKNGSIVNKSHSTLTILDDGAHFEKIQIGGGELITGHISASSFLDFKAPDSVPGSVDLTIQAPGAELGDTVTVGSPVSPGKDFILTGFVHSTGVVTVRWTQLINKPADPDHEGGNYRVDVWKHDSKVK